MDENYKETKDKSGSSKALAIILSALVVLIAGLIIVRSYLIKSSAEFDDNIYFPYVSTNQLAFLKPPQSKDPFIENGRFIYNSACAPCHQTDGNGVPGQYPPLAGSEWVQEQGSGRLIRLMLHGLEGQIEVKGLQFNNTMVPWKDLLNDSQIAAVLSFIRSEWGNKAPRVSPEQVKTIRDKTANRKQHWTAKELLQIPPYE